MTNIEAHRADATETCIIYLRMPMRVGVQMSTEKDSTKALMDLAERDAKLITNALIENLPIQTLALVRDRLTRFGKDES